ncbi:hypothetical protein GCM10027056_23960 [Glaciibacter psychrotolerans]
MSGNRERVVFVVGRPGDESLITGGTIARLRSDGALVSVLFGAVGDQPDSSTRTALAELDVTEWAVVPAASGGSIDDDDRELDAFLATLLRRIEPTAVVIGTDDDRLRSALTHAAMDAGTPVFVSRRVSSSASQRLTAIDVTAQVDQKLRAIAAYPGRWSVVDHTAHEPDGAVLAITGSEAYAQTSVGNRAGRADAEPDVTPVGRAAAAVLALIVGAVFGMLGTVAHQTTVSVFGWAFPIGLILAILATGALLVGLRLVLHDRLAVLGAALGMLGTIFLLSLKSVGGSVLIPAGTLGLVWTVVPALVAALVLAWPQLPPRR